MGLWILLFLICVPFALQLNSQLKAGGFNDPRGEAAAGQSVALGALSDADSQNRLIVTLQNTARGSVDADVPALTEALDQFPEVSGTTDYREQPQLLAEDSSVAVFLVQFRTDNVAIQNAVPSLRDYLDAETRGRPLTTHVTGTPALDFDLNEQSQSDAQTAEFIAFPLLILVLLLVFRAVVPTVITLVTAGVALVLSEAFGLGLAQFTDVSVLYTNAVSLIGLAVATDYSLFIIRRYRTELDRGGTTDVALRVASATAGHAVRVSGVAVIVAIAALLIPRTIVFTSIAVGGMIVTVAAVAMSASLLPAALTLIGSRISWGEFTLPGLRRRRRVGLRDQLLLSRGRAAVVVAVLVAVFAALAMPIASLQLQVPVASASILPSSADSRLGLEVAQEKTDARQLFPVQVVLRGERGTDTAAMERDINAVTEVARRTPGVENVSSVLSLQLPRAALESNGASLPAQLSTPLRQLWNVGADGSVVTQVLVTSSTLPDSNASHELVRSLKRDVASAVGPGSRVYVAGATAQGVDFDRLVTRSIPLIVLVVALLTFVLLGFAFRSWVLPLISLVLNGLVVGASMGLLTLLSQDVLGRDINSVTPVLVFAVMFGLSMDYMVIMITRMREEFANTGDHLVAMSEGMRSTAGLVNSAAAIMIAVFVSFLSAKISVVQQLGVGLAIAVFLDAFIVRMFLLPAVLRLFSGKVWGLRHITAAPPGGQGVQILDAGRRSDQGKEVEAS